MGKNKVVERDAVKRLVKRVYIYKKNNNEKAAPWNAKACKELLL